MTKLKYQFLILIFLFSVNILNAQNSISREKAYENLINFTKNSQLDSIKKLVEIRYKISSFFMREAIMIAIHFNNFEVFRYLVDYDAKYESNGRDINHSNLTGFPPFVQCVFNKNTQFVEYLLNNNKVNFNRYCGFLSIITTCKNGDLDMLKYLVSKGANLELEKHSALKIAMEFKQNEIVKYLIDIGADTLKDSMDFDSKNILQHHEQITGDIVLYISTCDKLIEIAANYGNFDCEPYQSYSLAETNLKYEVLAEACKYKKLDLIKKIFDIYTFDMDYRYKRSKDGGTILHVAISSGINIIKFLVQKGADINAVANYNYSILERAIGTDDEMDIETIEYLINSGVKTRPNLNFYNSVNKKDIGDYIVKKKFEFNDTLHNFAKKGDLEKLKYMWDSCRKQGYKCDFHISSFDSLWKTPIMYAVENNHLDVVKYLINTAYIHKKWGTPTALIIAIKLHHNEIAKYLIDHKAEFFYHEIKSPFLYACEYNNLEIVEYLINKLIDINVHDKAFKTGLFYACRNDNFKMVKFLANNDCNLDVVDKYNKKAIDYTKSRKIRKFLMNYKSDKPVIPIAVIHGIYDGKLSKRTFLNEKGIQLYPSDTPYKITGFKMTYHSHAPREVFECQSDTFSTDMLDFVEKEKNLCKCIFFDIKVKHNEDIVNTNPIQIIVCDTCANDTISKYYFTQPTIGGEFDASVDRYFLTLKNRNIYLMNNYNNFEIINYTYDYVPTPCYYFTEKVNSDILSKESYRIVNMISGFPNSFIYFSDIKAKNYNGEIVKLPIIFFRTKR